MILDGQFRSFRGVKPLGAGGTEYREFVLQFRACFRSFKAFERFIRRCLLPRRVLNVCDHFCWKMAFAIKIFNVRCSSPNIIIKILNLPFRPGEGRDSRNNRI